MGCGTEDEIVETKLLRVPEAAALLAVSVRGLWAMIASGKMPEDAIVRIGRNVRIRADVLQRWIAEGCPVPSGPKAVRT